MSIQCFDINNVPLNHLYQWDVNRTIKISGVNTSIIPEFHFSNRLMDKSISVIPTLSGGYLVAKIPDALLEQPEIITLFLYYSLTNSEKRTEDAIRIAVKPRAEPSEYEPFYPEYESAEEVDY